MPLHEHANPYRGDLYPDGDIEDVDDFIEGEPPWSAIGEGEDGGDTSPPDPR